MKHIQFLKNLSDLCFSGQLMFSGPAEQKWVIYFVQGRIVYAVGGVHPVRRWRRNLVTHCHSIPTYRLAWQISLSSLDSTSFRFGWEYALLALWVKQQKISREQALAVIRSTVVEVLFDTIQAAEVTSQIYPDRSETPMLDLLDFVDVKEAIAAVEPRWHVWQTTMLGAYSPNGAPVIKHPEKFQTRTSAPFYQTIAKFLNGQHTLYDLAVEMQRDVVDVASSLRLYVRMGWIDLISIPDLPAPISRQLPAAKLPSAPVAPQSALIACVDDSLVIRRTMEDLLTSAGYQFVGVDDALRAIGILLARKPDLIFLDLMMPHINGHELCDRLRKLSCFRETPIVILTGNDGYANRLRSNIAGATDFLSKPLNAAVVLDVIRKNLETKPLERTS